MIGSSTQSPDINSLSVEILCKIMKRALPKPSDCYIAIQVSNLWKECVLYELQRQNIKALKTIIQDLKIQKGLLSPTISGTQIIFLEQIVEKQSEIRFQSLPQFLSFGINMMEWAANLLNGLKWLNIYHNTAIDQRSRYLIDSVETTMKEFYGNQTADNFTYSDFASPLRFFCEEIQDEKQINFLCNELFTKHGLDVAKKFIYAASGNVELKSERFKQLSIARVKRKDYANATDLARAISLDSKWNQLAFIAWNAYLQNNFEWTRKIAQELALQPKLLMNLSHGIVQAGNFDFAREIAEYIDCKESKSNLLSYLKQLEVNKLQI